VENKKKFGFLSIVLLGINGIIGSGIFLVPGELMALVGPASMGIILIDMLLVISLALCFAEAGGMFKKNGGPYIYAREAFGDFIGFEVGFMRWIISIIAWSAMAVGFSTALSTIWAPAGEGIIKNIIAITIIVSLGTLNILGVSISKYLNNIATIGKLIPLILFIVCGVFFIKGNNYTPFFDSDIYVSGSFGTAILLMFYAFTGFEGIAIAAEDMENPHKNIPKAIIITILIVSIFYLSIQGIVIGILGKTLATSTAPLADAAGTFLGTLGFIIVAIGTLISIVGINISASFIAPRSAVALAKDGLLPRILAQNSKYGTPYLAIILTVVLAIPLVLTGSFTQLAVISVVSRFAQYIPTCAAILVFRKKRPDLIRTFTIPFGPIIPIIAISLSIWILSQSKAEQIIWGIGGLILAIPIYFIMKISNKTKTKENLQKKTG